MKREVCSVIEIYEYTFIDFVFQQNNRTCTKISISKETSIYNFLITEGYKINSKENAWIHVETYISFFYLFK